MNIRCPVCRHTTLVLEELIEHLTRCDRCGMMLHVKAAIDATTTQRRLVARALPRTVAVRAEGRALGIFSAPPPEPLPVAQVAEPEALPVDLVLAQLSAKRSAGRPRDPLHARRKAARRLWGYATLSASMATLVLASAVVVALKLQSALQPQALLAAVDPDGGPVAAAPAEAPATAPSQTRPATRPAPKLAAGPRRSVPAELPTGELFPQVKAR